MGVFDKSDAGVNSKETTIISSKAKINGNLKLESNVHIDGEVKGKIESKVLVSIGKDGFVEGEIYANKLVINGKFTGKAECENIEILKNGVLNGNIVVTNLIIEEGATFEGTCKKKGSAINDEAEIEFEDK
jgi:cytoskeletal protein CcmA (bactofilin family)